MQILPSVRYINAIIVLLYILFLPFLCGCDKNKITLRNFPFPYNAGMAFCSDIDNTDSIEEFLTIQEYLCTSRDTRWGTGLGLEIGNSFWFFDPSGTSDFTIFDSLGITNDSASKVIIDFINAGYIDFLHTYGNYTGYKFQREMADKSINWYREKDLNIRIWVNHGDTTNSQCIGKIPYQKGDDPGSAVYHTDLFREFGIEYVEIWRVTHRIALDADAGWHDRGFQIYEFAYSMLDLLKSGIFDPITNNRLLNPYELDDGQKFWRFRRFINDDGNIGESGVDAGYLAHQLRKENLDRLIKSGGYMVVYTHLGANEHYDEYLPEQTRDVLSDLAVRSGKGDIFITTLSRLLDYNRMTRHIEWEWQYQDGEYIIDIKEIADPVFNSNATNVNNLMGLTFYSPSPPDTRINYKGQPVENLQTNPPDNTGKSSITIPWRKLEYPDGY